MTAIPTRLRTEVREEVAQLCGSAPTGRELLAGVASRLRDAVPFDGCFLSSTDPDTLMFTDQVVVEAMPPTACRPFFHNEFESDDFNKFADLARHPGRVRTLSDATGGQLGRSARAMDVNARLGFGHEVRFSFTVGDRTFAVGSLTREIGRADFTAEERQLIGGLLPVVADGMRAAALVASPADALAGEALRVGVDEIPALASEAAEAPPVLMAPAGPGLVEFDAAGRPVSACDAAVHWLGAVDPREPLGPPTPFGFRLPLAAAMVVARARAHAAGRGSAPAEATLRTRYGTRLLLRAVCAWEPGGAPGVTRLVVAPIEAAGLAPEAAAAFRMSPREQEVTAYLARDLAPADIAFRTGLTVDTVAALSQNVLDKAAVASRTELVARIFAEYYYPAHNAGCRPLSA
ncbi:helix-turn-helix transcriptional regulator [Yinghuangia soli]|uniref:HTH luxR-type domain-containing protein n=1 Tax=Yinghuangia soli TaxID=2908204 RepID=A0AA41U122_9ACTN|nr:hypothetical protein [Yinghuangia soli]MCF2530368.1 hypothetical protein [Yinghuangia soli]